jgi:hypothetical protein
MMPETFPFVSHAMVVQCTRTLRQMDHWIDKARAHAQHRRFDANLLLQCRLAPDMFPLVRQYGSACDNAKLLGARLTGRQAPVHADNQASWDEVRVRIHDVVGWLDALRVEDFAQAASVKATFPWVPGKYLAAEAYLFQYALPNFHFHATTAYAILRHNGVEVGKADFLGALPFQDV